MRKEADIWSEMRTIDIHEAKEHLFRRVEQGAQGEPFITETAGKAPVKIVRVNAPEPGQMKRIGFLAGKLCVPNDFDGMGQGEIKRVFGLSLKLLRIAVDPHGD